MEFNRSNRIEALQEMASAISFDLTDMLTVISHKLNSVQSQIEKSQTSPTIKNDIEKIRSSVERLAKVAKGMRSLGQMGQEEALQLVDLKPMVNNVLQISKDWFENRNIDLKVSAIPETKLRCRTKQISQALINLLNNAIDAASDSEERRVWLDFSVSGKLPARLQISISDSGVLPLNIQDRILEPFFSTKPPGSGMGLGLNVCKSVAEGHAGKLFLDKASQKTRFVFEVPLPESA